MRIAIAVIAVLLALPAWAQTATLTCTPPTQYTDGTPIGTAAVTYKFYRGAASTGPFTLETRTSSTCSTVYSGLAVGTHWFVATATVNGVESAQTIPASKTILPPTPNPPSSILITREGYWLCNKADGSKTQHVAEPEAFESCANEALLAGSSSITPPGYRIVAR